jgi:molybdopterin-guanine dinucleotide biosynthesis protein MobB
MDVRQRGGERGVPPVVGIVGRSGAGKTSLLERLIVTLAGEGRRVGAAKHASHGFLADRPGKDSHRLYESGAQAVALLSPQQSVTFTRRDAPPSLAAALAALPLDLDLVLAEGFSWEPIPRVAVVGPGRPPKLDDLTGGEVIAMAKVQAYPPGEPAVFSETTLAAVEAAIVGRLVGAGLPVGRRGDEAARQEAS